MKLFLLNLKEKHITKELTGAEYKPVATEAEISNKIHKTANTRKVRNKILCLLGVKKPIFTFADLNELIQIYLKGEKTQIKIKSFSFSIFLHNCKSGSNSYWPTHGQRHSPYKIRIYWACWSVTKSNYSYDCSNAFRNYCINRPTC